MPGRVRTLARRLREGSALYDSYAAEESGICRGGCGVAGVGDRREYGDFRPDQRGNAAYVAREGARTAGADRAAEIRGQACAGFVSSLPNLSRQHEINLSRR